MPDETVQEVARRMAEECPAQPVVHGEGRESCTHPADKRHSSVDPDWGPFTWCGLCDRSSLSEAAMPENVAPPLSEEALEDISGYLIAAIRQSVDGLVDWCEYLPECARTDFPAVVAELRRAREAVRELSLWYEEAGEHLYGDDDGLRLLVDQQRALLPAAPEEVPRA